MGSQSPTKLSRAHLILLPTALWLAVFMLLPLLILLVYSLGSRNALGQIELGFSFHNYARFFTGPYLAALGRSIVLSGLTTLICLAVGSLFSIWLAFKIPSNRQQLFVTFLVAPLWTSFLLRIYAWMTILRPTGILSHLFQLLNWHDVPVILYTPYAVLIGMVYNYLPYMILPIYTAFEKLDRRLLEAAADLGATPLQTFFKVTAPLSSKGLVAGCVMVFVPALGDYVTPDLLGGAKTMFIGNLIQNQFLTVRDWAFGCAVSTILIMIVALFVWIYLRYGESEIAA
ncbi:MAG: ABC transporter permease [Candidatus Obscuribacterales bacterium]|nr:ABC transporter permease [Candidatus Obscuribacterales bacterium]